MKHKFEPDEAWKARFWNKVDKGPHPKGCWMWTAAKNPRGYGMVAKWPGKRSDNMMLAHRASFFMSGGTLTVASNCVLHSCHTPACVNPEHLRAGTRKQNAEDMVRAGRSLTGERNTMRKHPELAPKGERNGRVRFTESDILTMRDLHANGATQLAIAAMFKTTSGAMSQIINKKLWKHLP